MEWHQNRLLLLEKLPVLNSEGNVKGLSNLVILPKSQCHSDVIFYLYREKILRTENLKTALKLQAFKKGIIL